MLVQVFLAAMALAVLAASLGVLWVAIEATTIVTAFLVGQRRGRARGRGRLEVRGDLLDRDRAGPARHLPAELRRPARTGPGRAGLGRPDRARRRTWTRASPGSRSLLLILGFGTKAGLAPLHAWLPDAHSQAPAPVSALMSGVLLSVAFYAILRVKVIADVALGPDFARTLLIVLALASLAVAASLLIAQRDYKRMLAYSSIEHMGLLALGAAIGSPLAIAAVLLHILGHGLAKSVAVPAAPGRSCRPPGTSRIDRGPRPGRPANRCSPAASALGVLALIAFPPFSLFASELGIARAGFAAGLGWVTAAALRAGARHRRRPGRPHQPDAARRPADDSAARRPADPTDLRAADRDAAP